MSVRIQLENGKIKEYSTFWDDSSGEPGPVNYYSKCGLKWDNWPGKSGGCEHIDCAIAVIDTNNKRFSIVWAITLGLMVIITLYSGGDSEDWGSIFFFWTITGMLFLLFIWIGNRDKRQLKEFENYGTVNGLMGRKL